MRGEAGAEKNKDDTLHRMKKNQTIKNLAVAGSCLASLFALSSCGADEQQPEQASAAEQVQAPVAKETAPQATAEEQLGTARDILFDYMLFTQGKVVSSLASAPQLNEFVKEMLEKIEAYYAELNKAEQATPERVRVGLRLAEICRSLNAYAKAKGYYESAEKDLATLPEGSRTSLDGMRLTSSIKNGLATCLLYTAQGFDEPKKLYAEALQTDEAIFNGTLPKQDNLTADDITPAVSDATCELLGSYRCLADCIRRSGDPEEAREILKKGIAKAGQLGRLDTAMVISFCRLLSDLGDLENAAGNKNEALNSWGSAQNLLRNSAQVATKQHLLMEIKQLFERLTPCIRSVQAELQASEQPQPDAPASGAAPAPDATAPAAITPAASTAAAPGDATTPQQAASQPQPAAAPTKGSKQSAGTSSSRRKKKK